MTSLQTDHSHGKPTRFTDSWRNLGRITTVRIIVQTVIFGLFVTFVLLTTFSSLERMPNLRYWVGKILEVDPLISISTAITTHTVYRGLLWSLVILIPTFFLGRFFCNWICPYGTLHHFIGWMTKPHAARKRIGANSYRPAQQIKYYILLGMLVAAIFGALQIGLLDPICLLYRSLTGAAVPAAQMTSPELLGDYGIRQGAWFIGFVLFTFLALNLVIPRFFCRIICPLGALLGVLGRFAWWRIERDHELCNHCNRCRLNCEAACDPQGDLRKSECFVCFNCIEDCPEKALSFRIFPPKEHEVTSPDVTRRRLVVAGLAGLAFYPFARATGRTTRDFSSKAIRPPGTVEELEFLARCIKCDQCVRVCPTSVIQPAWFESGIEGLWTPVLNFRVGHCQFNCTACGYVCPTGAIQHVTLDQKLGRGDFADAGPIRLGMAHVDPGRCLPFSKNVPCVVCEEVCPTSPKAIHGERIKRIVRDGKKRVAAATEDTLTLTDWPEAGRMTEEPAAFLPDQYRGDNATSYHVELQHPNGIIESHRITANTADSVSIDGPFAQAPMPGATVVIQIELIQPHVDTALCIGCGLCERECPVVGDRRAVYVTAEGETRSQIQQQRDRNRSVRLIGA